MLTYEIETAIIEEQPTAVVRGTVRVSDIGSWLQHAYGETAHVIAVQGAHPAGPPFGRYTPLGDGRFHVEAGFPVAHPIAGSDYVEASTLPGGHVATTVHHGPYDRMGPAYEALASWVASHGGVSTGDAWEVYFSDPSIQPDPSTWVTQVVQPFRYLSS